MIDNENRAVSSGIFLDLAAGFFLILLKLVGLIEWSWLWVTLPLWIVPCGVVVVLIAVGQAVLLGLSARWLGSLTRARGAVRGNGAILYPLPRRPMNDSRRGHDL